MDVKLLQKEMATDGFNKRVVEKQLESPKTLQK